jgi:hypothetical protein
MMEASVEGDLHYIEYYQIVASVGFCWKSECMSRENTWKYYQYIALDPGVHHTAALADTESIHS